MDWAGGHNPDEAGRGANDLDSALRAHIEWLFSDANLHKDRFLLSLVEGSADGTVALSRLATFYRVAALSRSIPTLSRALTESRFLALSPDGLRVGRREPYVAQPDAAHDACTVYVERLPLHSHHASIGTYFARYGPVVHVSMPRFRVSRRFKGFAFVQFATPAAARAAVADAAATAAPPGHAPLLTAADSHDSAVALPVLAAAAPPAAAAAAAAAPPPMLVMSKARWAELKAAAKAAQVRLRLAAQERLLGAPPAAAAGAPAVGSGASPLSQEAAAAEAAAAVAPALSEAAAAAAEPSPPSCLVRFRGVPRHAAFRHLRDLVSQPGRPAFVDCPTLFSNGVRVADPTRSSSAAAEGAPGALHPARSSRPRLRAASASGGGAAALSPARRAAARVEHSAAAAAAAAAATEAEAALGAAPGGDDAAAAADDAPALVRYLTPAEAARAVAFFASPTAPRLGGRALSAELVAGADAEAYAAAVEVLRLEYQQRRQRRRRQGGRDGGRAAAAAATAAASRDAGGGGGGATGSAAVEGGQPARALELPPAAAAGDGGAEPAVARQRRGVRGDDDARGGGGSEGPVGGYADAAAAGTKRRRREE